MARSVRNSALLLCCLLHGLVVVRAADQPKTESFTYKTTKQADLELIVHYPSGWSESDQRPAIVFFFGGGWTGGRIGQFEPQAIHLANRGMVAVRADYRVKSRHGVTPRECVEDAKSAVRWVRARSGQLGVDPDRIVAAGGSAGGHIAACTALTPGLDADDEDPEVSSRPNALVLFNPVLRFSDIPQLMERIGNDEVLGKAISPTLHLTKDSPPTLIFFGTTDRLAAMGDEFMDKSKRLGHRAELFTAEGQPHGFFNRSPWLERTIEKMDAFLVSLGYLQPAHAGATLPVQDQHGMPTIVDTNKAENRVEVNLEKDAATMEVFSPGGIGRATVTATDGTWPAIVVLRLRLRGLEHLAISDGKITLTGSVLSHSDNAARLRWSEHGNEAEQEPETTIRVFDADGKPTMGLPPDGGCFELTLPQALLKNETNRLELEWIDFYRG